MRHTVYYLPLWMRCSERLFFRLKNFNQSYFERKHMFGVFEPTSGIRKTCRNFRNTSDLWEQDFRGQNLREWDETCCERLCPQRSGERGPNRKNGDTATLIVRADNYNYNFFVRCADREQYLGSGQTKYLTSEVSGGFTGTMTSTARRPRWPIRNQSTTATCGGNTKKYYIAI